MKKIVFMSAALASTCLSALVVSTDLPTNLKSWENPSINLQIVKLSDLTENSLNELMRGNQPEIAVKFPSQTILPITFFLKGDLINLIESEEDCRQIKIMQTFYARCVHGELILSTDLKDWKPILEFITGEASFTLNVRDGIPSIVTGTEINRRT